MTETCEARVKAAECLRDALAATEADEKNFYIREALQLLTLA